MAIRIKISYKSSTPKYEQLVNEIIKHIRDGKLLLGDKLPSIHEVTNNNDISRDTVVFAYNELKARGIISPKHGKGFYVSSTTFFSKLKIFMLFDVMNGYKEVLYRSLADTLGPDYQVDIYFHYYNLKVFEQLITNNLDKYGFYVIMPHFNEDVSQVVNLIPRDKLLVIDKDLKSLETNYAAVYQDFKTDVYEALKEAIPFLRKYSDLKFISNHNFQFIPEGMEQGFSDFCRDHKVKHDIFEDIESSLPEKGDAFLVVSDHDLIQLIKTCLEEKWELGKDIGIVSYDETPLKEILSGGIAVISTDFKKMGETAAEMIKSRVFIRKPNPSVFIPRNSL
jgi:DNA-binding transcriptional regulator YhcF (GntR family)/DNA-binding LacI/PurR family transcriptional regulator